MQSPEDSYNLNVLSDPFVHENEVYFTKNWIEADEYRSSIFRYDGKNISRVTFNGREKSPQLHGGRLYYISYNKEKETLMVLEEMKEPRAVYTNKSISKYTFHGNGILAITQDDHEKDVPFVTDRVKYRFDTAGFYWTRKKLVLISGDEVTQLVAGDFEVVDVSSNGKKVVFSATIEDDDRALEDVYELDMGDKSYKRLTDGEGKAGKVSVSQDGVVAYIGHRKGPTPWASSSLIFPENGKEVRVGNTAHNKVGCDLFVPPAEPLVLDNGKYYLIGQEKGSTFVYSFDGNKVEKLTESNRAVRTFHVSGGKIAHIYTSPEKPSLLSFGTEYDPNPEIVGRIPEKIDIEGREAWAIIAGKDKPTVLSVHGGPQGAYGNAYSIEFNHLADNGFNVIYGNPRGSDGYGEEFAKGCVGDWGGKDFGDLLEFVDIFKEKFSLPENFAITGGSYGGFMTCNAIVKTDRFKAAIAERCVSNLMSMCGTSDIGFWFNAMESGVKDPWSPEGMQALLDMSPVTQAKNVKTPTMFTHGEIDYRCPIEQSEQMYSAIKLNGIETQLVRYPGDSHEHARRGVPKNMKDRLSRKLKWFQDHMN